jgi:hypothetical protein
MIKEQSREKIDVGVEKPIILLPRATYFVLGFCIYF